MTYLFTNQIRYHIKKNPYDREKNVLCRFVKKKKSNTKYVIEQMIEAYLSTTSKVRAIRFKRSTVDRPSQANL